MRARSNGVLFVIASLVGLLVSTVAQATVYHPAGIAFTATPGVSDSWSSDKVYAPSTLDGDLQGLGLAPPSSLATAAGVVETTLESASWLNMSLTFVDAAGCTTAGCPTGFNTGSSPGPYGAVFTLPAGEVADVFGIWYDNKFLALLYSSPISAFTIDGLPNKVSDIFAYSVNPVPLPPAVLLFGTALVGMGVLGRRRHKRQMRTA